MEVVDGVSDPLEGPFQGVQLFPVQPKPQVPSLYVVSYVLCSHCSGLPPSGSWQDLKDHMREAGDVCYADVQKDGMGVVEFLRKEDMEYALRKLDDTKFRSHEVGPCLWVKSMCVVPVMEEHALTCPVVMLSRGSGGTV